VCRVVSRVRGQECLVILVCFEMVFALISLQCLALLRYYLASYCGAGQEAGRGHVIALELLAWRLGLTCCWPRAGFASGDGEVWRGVEVMAWRCGVLQVD
jgi:hypothetical protein